MNRNRLIPRHVRRLAMIGALGACSIVPSFAVNPNPQSPPWIEDVFTQDCAGHEQTMDVLFWTDCPELNTPDYWAGNLSCNQNKVAQGIFPIAGLVRWGGEGCHPSNASCGKNAYSNWLDARPQYRAVTHDGSVYTTFGCSDVVLPSMPLDQADWPAGMTNATYGDWVADRVSSFAGKTGIVGGFSADFFDCIPHSDANNVDFSQRSIEAFERFAGITIAGATTSARSEDILNNHRAQWLDFICDGYAHQWATMARLIKERTGNAAFIGMQGTDYIADQRVIGRDIRMISKQVTDNGGFYSRFVECQGDGGRPLCPLSMGHLHVGSFACNAPSQSIGAQLSAPNPGGESGFEDALNGCWNGSDAVAKAEFADKYIKAHWLTIGWAQTANLDGTVRRATQAFGRQYDGGAHAPQAAVDQIMAHQPTHPFGIAAYYSKSIADAVESERSTWRFTDDLQQAIERGVPVGYYLSDLHLGSFGSQPQNKPTAFVTSELSRMNPDERARLNAIAPVYDVSAIGNVSTIPSPIRFSSGVLGYAFVDQNAKTIILTYRPTSDGWDWHDYSRISNAAVQATVSFSGVRNGSYTATDLFDTTQHFTFSIVNGSGSFTYTHARWDCRAFSTTVAAPNADASVMARPGALSHRLAISASNGSITYTVPTRSAVRLELFSVSGRRVRTLVAETLDAGVYTTRTPGTSSISDRGKSTPFVARLTVGGECRAVKLLPVSK